MGVIIKDMEMPDSCSDCRFYDTDHGDYPTCNVNNHSRGYKFNGDIKRMSDCPLINEEMEYKFMLFEIPSRWDSEDCVIKIENNKVTIDHQIDYKIFERCVSDLFDGNDFEIRMAANIPDDWETEACIAAGR